MDWFAILTRCGVAAPTATSWAPRFDAAIRPGTFSLGNAELDEFLGQILHESMYLERLVESLNYSTAERICAVWPRRFPTPADARPFVRNPVALANRVYGGRMGNTAPDHGWLYRGRGLMMITGLDGYLATGDAIGVDLVREPDKLAHPPIALRAAVAWWEDRIPDRLLGDDDIRAERRLVNGGEVGLAECQRITRAARLALAAA